MVAAAAAAALVVGSSGNINSKKESCSVIISSSIVKEKKEEKGLGPLLAMVACLDVRLFVYTCECEGEWMDVCVCVIVKWYKKGKTHPWVLLLLEGRSKAHQ